MAFNVRKVKESDCHSLLNLYKKVSKVVGGIARNYDEVTEDYISHNLTRSSEHGISLVVENPSNEGNIIAEIHCCQPEPSVFSHVLSDLTIVVDPDFQGKGLGKLVFRSLLAKIENTRNDIFRVELIARESNQKAIRLYQKLGFQVEGRFENRIYNDEKKFEADIAMAWFNKNYNKPK